LTDGAFQGLPLQLLMPRRASSAAIARKLKPASSFNTGSISTLGGGRQQLRIAELLALRLLGSERIAGAARNQGPLFLGQCNVQMQQEWVDVDAQLGDDERSARKAYEPGVAQTVARPVNSSQRPPSNLAIKFTRILATG
jgi:hypothetical protein